MLGVIAIFLQVSLQPCNLLLVLLIQLQTVPQQLLQHRQPCRHLGVLLTDRVR